MTELASLLALKLISRKKIAENADVALNDKLRPQKYGRGLLHQTQDLH